MAKDCYHVPLNPAILPDGLTEADYMTVCITMLLLTDAIYLMNGLLNSTGARTEHALALKLGLEVIEQRVSSHE